MTGRKVEIKSAEMPKQMQKDAVNFGTEALDKNIKAMDIAAYIKKEFDKKYKPTWQCVVGRHFGSYVTHQTDRFIYFYLGQIAILLFKTPTNE